MFVCGKGEPDAGTGQTIGLIRAAFREDAEDNLSRGEPLEAPLSRDDPASGEGFS